MDLLFPANPKEFSLNSLSTPLAAKRMVADIKAFIPEKRKIGVNDFYLFLTGRPSKPAIVQVLAQSLAAAKKGTADKLWDSYSEALQAELRPMLNGKCPGAKAKKVEKVEKPPAKKVPPPKKAPVLKRRTITERRPPADERIAAFVPDKRITPRAIKAASTFQGWNEDQRKRVATDAGFTDKGLDIVGSRTQPLSYSTKRWSSVVMSLVKDPFQRYIAEIALEDPLELQVAGVGLFNWTDYIISAEETLVLQKAMKKLHCISGTEEMETWPPEMEALKEMFQERYAEVTKKPYITRNKKLLQYFGSFVREN